MLRDLALTLDHTLLALPSHLFVHRVRLLQLTPKLLLCVLSLQLLLAVLLELLLESCFHPRVFLHPCLVLLLLPPQLCGLLVSLRVQILPHFCPCFKLQGHIVHPAFSNSNARFGGALWVCPALG